MASSDEKNQLSASKWGDPLFDYSAAWVTWFIAILNIMFALLVGRGVNTDTQPSLYYWSFVCGLAVLSFLLYLLQGKQLRIADIENKQIQFAIRQQQKELTRSLQDMPPANAYRTYIMTYLYVLDSLRLAQESKNEDPAALVKRYERMIRGCLTGVARLFADFKHRGVSLSASANFAYLVHHKDWERDQTLRDRVEEKIRFVSEKHAPLRGLHGALHIDPELSAYTSPHEEEGDDHEPNHKLLDKEMYLPIIETTHYNDSEVRARTIPIAPQAFYLGKFFVSRISELCSEEYLQTLDILPSLSKEICEHFSQEAQNDMGSVLSLRLVWNTRAKSKEKRVTLGVLTIYTESDSQFDRHMVESYIDMIQPLLELQMEILVELVKQKGAAGKPE